MIVNDRKRAEARFHDSLMKEIFEAENPKGTARGYNPEADEISPEDLKAAADFYDRQIVPLLCKPVRGPTPSKDAVVWPMGLFYLEIHYKVEAMVKGFNEKNVPLYGALIEPSVAMILVKHGPTWRDEASMDWKDVPDSIKEFERVARPGFRHLGYNQDRLRDLMHEQARQDQAEREAAENAAQEAQDEDAAFWERFN